MSPKVTILFATLTVVTLAWVGLVAAAAREHFKKGRA